MHDKAQTEKSISWNRYDLWTIKPDTAWSSDGISNKSQEGKPLTRLETLFGVFSMHAIPHLILSSCEPDCFVNCSNAFPATVMRWNFIRVNTISYKFVIYKWGALLPRYRNDCHTALTSAKVAILHHLYMCVLYWQIIQAVKQFSCLWRSLMFLFHYLRVRALSVICWDWRTP